jgi:hypothetical protein
MGGNSVGRGSLFFSQLNNKIMLSIIKYNFMSVKLFSQNHPLRIYLSITYNKHFGALSLSFAKIVPNAICNFLM